MPAPAEFDAAIVGGGPAGSTVARCLALHGHRVCLLHRAPQADSLHSRWETLSPGTFDLLRLHHFDVWPSIAQLLVPCSTSVLWTRSDKPSEQGAIPHGMLVDRRLLDPILRASATAAGADCLEVGANMPLPLIDRGSVAWCLSFNQSAAPDIRSRFLVDAAGRSSAIRRTRLTLAPTTLALTASVVDARLDPDTTCVEALRDGWLWAGNGSGSNAVVTLFVSPWTVRGWPLGEHSARFLEMLCGSSLLAGGGTSPRLASNFRAHDATAAERTPFTADGLLRVGDAALALDPLSGQGIQRALVSATQAATVLHTMLVREESAGLAGQFYIESHREAARKHAMMCQAFYRRQDRFDGAFWRERTSEIFPPSPPHASWASLDAWLDERLMLSHAASWKNVPVIAGEFIENRRALCHPSLSRPIAFLEGEPAAEMLANLSAGVTGPALLRQWAERYRLPTAAGARALQLLARHGILQPAGRKSGASRYQFRCHAPHY